VPFGDFSYRGINWALNRPVSLMSQICKVSEAVVRDEVVEFLDKHKLIWDFLHGF